ncbi:DsbE family thiol:disulfide interchange protein [Pontivivens insulae]|nr:DsbE family thiol:disulfide interchange protein [Pontivivens insulae]
MGVFLWGMLRENPDELDSVLTGRPAPTLTIDPFEGMPEPELTGQVTLVNFWASWCGPCRVEHPVLMDLADEGLAIVGINYKDDPANAQGFLAELGNPYTSVGADNSGRTGIDWGIYGVPETFVLDADGQIILRFPGPVTQSALENRIRPAIAEAAGG